MTYPLSLRATNRLVMATAIGVPVAAGALLIPLRDHLDTADGALVLVLVIVAIATSGRRLAAMAAALMSALSFDFFLTRPYGSLQITRSTDLATELLLLVVGLAVGDLAARGRTARQAARQSADELAQIHVLTEMVAAGEEPHVIAIAAANQLRALLSLRDCRFSRSTTERVVARITPDGGLTVGRERWSTGDLGLPTKHVELPVRGNGHLLGSFVLTPTPGLPVSRQRLVVAVAIADQLGAALATDHALPSSS